MRYASCPTSQKAVKLHHFLFTMSNHDYRLLSRSDTQIFSHCILYISHNALNRIVYAIFQPPFQAIQRCSLHWKGHIDDLFDMYQTQDLAVYHVSS